MNKNKKAKEVGMEYFGKKRVDDKWNYDIKRVGRKIKDRCSCKANPNRSKLKCNTITEEERMNIFRKVWELSWSEKTLYVDLFVVVRPTTRARDRKNNDSSRRENLFLYFLEKDQEKIRVCKYMFLHTLDIGEKAIRNCKNQNKKKGV